MASYIVVTIKSNETISQSNDRLIKSSNNNIEGITQLRNYLDKILAGNIDGTVQVTVRDTDPSVTTSGTGSKQSTHKVH